MSIYVRTRHYPILGANWGSNDMIVFGGEAFGTGKNEGLSQVSAAGGTPTGLTTIRKDEYSHRCPEFLPGSKAVVFTVYHSLFDPEMETVVESVETHERLLSIKQAADAHYLASGHLVYASMGTLVAVPFDLARLSVTGPGVPVLGSVMQCVTSTNSDLDSSAAQVSFSSSGLLLYAPGGINPPRKSSLVLVDRRGQVRPVFDFPQAGNSPRFSPDGTQVAFRDQARPTSLWIYDLVRSQPKMVSPQGNPVTPIWTPDGKALAYASRGNGIYLQTLDSSEAPERLYSSGKDIDLLAWNPDGSHLAFAEGERILVWRRKDGQIKTVIQSPRPQGLGAAFSPDGRWLAFSSAGELNVCSFPDAARRYQVDRSASGPAWAASGHEIFYRKDHSGVAEMWVVDIATDPRFTSGKPRILFKNADLIPTVNSRNFDVSTDGKQFVMIQRGEEKPQPVTELILVQHWFEELKRLAPTGKN